MKEDIVPYKVAEICYHPDLEYPWYIVRVGTVAEQGGFNFGKESLSFKELRHATSYLNSMISDDIELLKAEISKKEGAVDGNDTDDSKRSG